MRRNKTKRLMREGKMALGTFSYFPSPWTVEIAGHAGLDFVIIDLEHSAKDLMLVESMVLAAELYDMTAIVRVPSADEKIILQVLETGAQGIIVPLVGDAETARRAVAATRYPPDGVRGVCRSTRAANFGTAIPKFADFAQAANDEMMVIALIEDRAGVENADAIARSGVDGILIGPADLSGSLGVMGDLGHPLVKEAIARVTDAVLSSNACWLGNLVFSPEQVAQGYERGMRFFSYGIDTQILALAYKNAAEQSRAAVSGLADNSPAKPRKIA
ncbi:MAG: HpcH/HpaI aldolase/citrate lyase family protein [Rhizobiaceae bacterium]